MLLRKISLLLTATSFIALAVLITGCDGTMSTTDDSTAVGIEAPKVEMGDAPLDLNPTTDHDVDVDTPIKGDS